MGGGAGKSFILGKQSERERPVCPQDAAKHTGMCMKFSDYVSGI